MDIIAVGIVTVIVLAIMKDIKGFLMFCLAVFIAYFLVAHTHFLGWLWHAVVSVFNALLHFSFALLGGAR